MSVCAKFQLPRSGVKVCGSGVVWGGFQVSTMYNLNPRCIEMELGLGFDNYSNEISCNWEKKLSRVRAAASYLVANSAPLEFGLRLAIFI